MAHRHSLWDRVLRSGGLEPVFQPIVSLAHGGLFAYEALSRPWLKDGSAPSISDLVQRVQAEGREPELDALAIRSIALRAHRLPAGARLFVNCSPATLLDRPEALGPLASLGGRVAVEVTERTLIPEERLLEFRQAVDRLRDRGVEIAVDDCGAGYSGLNRLAWLRPDFAKIDMELVRDVDRDGAKASLVAALVLFARRSGIEVIAEGVETEAEREALAELGVDYVQGYLVGRPAAAFRTVRTPPAREAARRPASPDPRLALGAALRLAHLASRGLGDAAGLHEAIVQAVRHATGADGVALYRRGGRDWRPLAHAGSADPALSLPRSLLWEGDAPNLGVPQVVLRQTRREASRESPFGSGLVAPVRVQGATWGLLSVGYFAENRVRADLVEFVVGIADQVSLILAARGGTAPRADPPLLNALRFVAAHPGDWSDLLQRLIRDLEVATGSHDCWLGVVAGGHLWVLAEDGVPVPTDLEEWRRPEGARGHMPPGVAMREGRTVVVPDVREEPTLAAVQEELLAHGIISAAAVPVVAAAEVLGVLKVCHSARDAFPPDRLRYLEEVAAMLVPLVKAWRPPTGSRPALGGSAADLDPEAGPGRS